MNSVAITGTARTVLGKKATKAVRKEGLIPCNIYGGKGNVHFSAPAKAFKSLIYTPDFKLAEITVGSNTHTAIIKEIQSHPVTDNILHIDFVELVDGKSIKAQIPIRLTGTAEGAKMGGVVIQKLRRAKVKTTPEKLVDAIELDISSLDLGDSARVRDIIEIEGVEILNYSGSPIASVEVPRSLRSEQSDEEEGEGGTTEEGAEGATAAEATK